MRSPSVIFLLLIPAFIALGHDIYLFYVNVVQTKGFTLDLLLGEFKFSSLGYIWTTYEPESFQATLESTDKDTWLNIDYILTFTAFYAGLGFAAIISVILAFFGLALGWGPLALGEGRSSSGKTRKETSFRAGNKGGKFEYKRK
jgi:hypothetical protein